MEGSGQRACSGERVNYDLSSGSPERDLDHSLTRKESKCTEKDVSKCPTFKSPTYTCSADDSGFVENCPPAECEDPDVWSVQRDQLMQRTDVTPASLCSTLNTTYGNNYKIFNAAGSSSIHYSKTYKAAPFTAGQFFLPHNDSQILFFNPSKVIFNTVFDNAIGNRKQANVQVQQTEPKLVDNTFLEPLQDGQDKSTSSSEFYRGHSTIASLLNSLPLNLDRSEKGEGQKLEVLDKFPIPKYSFIGEVFTPKNPSNVEFASAESNSYSEYSLAKNISSVEVAGASSTLRKREYTGTKRVSEIKNEILDDNIREEVVTSIAKFQNTSDNETTFEQENDYSKPYIDTTNQNCGVPEIYDSQGPQEADENNNFLLAQKYSDISDACASETETTSDTSSSEEELPAYREVNIKSTIKRKSKRKSTNPRRSAVKEDPRFKGVTVWLQTSFLNGQSGLQISAFYSNVKVVSPRRGAVYQRKCSTPRCFRFSDQEGTSPAYKIKENHPTVKTCASCKTRRTPLWRDADDGTPLCNACGIRYKKYRLRCSKCWHIPKKEVKTYPNCPVCASSLRYSFHKKAW